MRVIELDGRQMYEKKTAHAYLEMVLEFPDYYGGNLDALYDCLTDVCEDTMINIKTYDLPWSEEGQYLGKILDVFREAADENPDLMIQII